MKNLPIASRLINEGSLITKKDLVPHKTDSSGLTFNEILDLQSKKFIIKNQIEKNSTILFEDFKKASIGIVVACRMKSSRLKRKAILNLNGTPSVLRCLENCKLIKGINHIILATSNLKEDAILKDYAKKAEVLFWEGDPDDVIKRYVGACEKFGIDIVVRVTADCPLISPEIAGALIKNHFEKGSDFTAPKTYSIGSSPEIYSLNALKKILSIFWKCTIFRIYEFLH